MTNFQDPVSNLLFSVLEGVCPEYARDHNNVCINKCDSDESCYGTTKCCQTHCGRDCVYPQRPENCEYTV